VHKRIVNNKVTKNKKKLKNKSKIIELNLTVEEKKKLKNSHKRRKQRVKKAKQKRLLLKNHSEQPATINRPLMKVKIHCKNYRALLDTGSDLSLVGQKIFERLREKGVKVWYISQKIKMLNGITDIIGGITTKVYTPAGTTVHRFFCSSRRQRTSGPGKGFHGKSSRQKFFCDANDGGSKCAILAACQTSSTKNLFGKNYLRSRQKFRGF